MSSSSSEEQIVHPTSNSRHGGRSKPNPNDVIKILISTDNHLGYMEKDPVRGDDSFRAFEEVLEIARVNKVDMVLLGGDFFHENKPSRSTVVRAMRILRNLCMSPEGAIRLAVRSDPSLVNYMNDCVAVCLPVFAIHGNHDDPTGGTGLDALSSLDLLAEAGLITYFGKTATSKKIEVSPILLQKGRTGLALYGLGNVRDEILYDTWAKQRNVKWLSPEEPGNGRSSQDSGEDSDAVDVRKWFNLFVLHQNRNIRGSAKGITDTMLPPWLDYVVWGHEHDSIPDLTQTKPPVVQPGSTVATSLSKGESKQKHAIMLEVFDGKAKHRIIPLRTVRNFRFDEVVLSEQENLSETDPDALKLFLSKTVDEMVKKQESLYDKILSDIQSETSNEQINGVRYPPRSWYRQKLTRLMRQPLIRLRVEASGNWETPSPHRFGQDFVGRVACPADILLFYRSKRQPLRRSRTYIQGYGGEMGTVGDRGDGDEMDLTNDFTMSQLDSGEQNALQIPSLVQYYLCHPSAGGSGLKFLELDKLTQAVDQFVNKTEKDAISDYINAFLKDQQRKTLLDATENNKGWDEDELLKKFKSSAALAEKRLLIESDTNGRTKEQGLTEKNRDSNQVGNSERSGDANDDVREVSSRLDTIHAVVTSNPKIVTANANTRATRERFEQRGDDKDEIEPSTTTKSRSSRGRGRGKGRGTASTRKPPTSARQSATPRRSVRKVQTRLSQVLVEDSDNEIVPDGNSAEDEDDYVPVSSTRKRRARSNSSLAPSSSRARTDSLSASVSRRGSTSSRGRPRRNTATIDVDEESGDDAM